MKKHKFLTVLQKVGKLNPPTPPIELVGHFAHRHLFAGRNKQEHLARVLKIIHG